MTIHEAYQLGLVVQVYDEIGCGCSSYNDRDGCCYGDCDYMSPPIWELAGLYQDKLLIELCIAANQVN